MSSIIIPGKWNRQPQYSCDVAEEYSGAAVWTPIDHKRTGSVYNPGVCALGLSSRMDGLQSNTSNLDTLDNNLAGLTGAVVLVSLVPYALPSGTTEHNIYARWGWGDSSSWDYSWGVLFRGTTVGAYFANSSTVLTACYASGYTHTAGKPITIAVLWDGTKSGTDRITFVINGKTYSATSWYTNGSFSTLGNAPTVRTTIGCGYYFGGTPEKRLTSADIVLCATIPKLLPKSKLIDLTNNPWQIFAKRPQVLYFDVGGGGPTTYTNTSSLDAAIQQARTATASLGAAIQQNRTASASVGAAIQAAFSATASLDSAIQRAASATTSLDAYIAAAGAQTSNASLDAAIQQARAATASLGAAVQAALAASASIDAAVLFSGSASAGLDAYVQVAGSSAAIASLDAAIQSAGSATAALGAAIQTARSATASLGAAVRVSGSASASVDAYILAGSLATASLDAAIMATVGASASLNAYIYVASDHAALSAPRTGTYSNTSTATRSNLQTARRPRS